MFFKRTKRKIRLICFDLDNTLFDYRSAEAETEAYIAERLHIDLKHALHDKTHLQTIDILRAFTAVRTSYVNFDPDPEHYSRKLWIIEMLRRLNINPKDIPRNYEHNKKKKSTKKKLGKKSRNALDEFAESYEDLYWEYLMTRMRLFPQTLHVLSELKKTGIYEIAAITNSDGRKDIKLRRIIKLGLGKFFDYIVTSDDTGINKPAIENFQYALKIAHVSADETMMIGDHPEVDLKNAKKTGFVTVWTKQVLPTIVHYPYVDHEITDIVQLLDIMKTY